MKTMQEALVKPELLIWARKSSKLDIELAAKRIGTSRARLEQWESGETKPSIKQLRKMAQVYKRPLAVFYLPKSPSQLGFDAMRDFRRFPDIGHGDISPELAFELRRAEERRLAAIELASGAETDKSILNLLRMDMDPVEAGEKVRILLGIKIEQQFKWKDNRLAFNEWKDAIENKGILVFQTNNISLDEMRGAAISAESFPVILLNGKDYINGKIFTLIHELSHICLNQSGICDLYESGPEQKTEVFCNAVAGTALVPPQNLLEDEAVLNHKSCSQWIDPVINQLSKKFSVSSEVILRRLLTLGLTTEEFYQKKREEYSKIIEEELAKEKEKQKEKKSHPPRYRMVIRNNGKRYVKMVVRAYLEDSITATDVADYLDVKLKHLPSLEEALFGAKGQ